ncbi:hypothetical protein AB0D33_19660 [Streptomyces sp. NPDC048404]|uniref:hypothetical protein n=1 Tax=unclassified Streptomyces TaxID=2593676 RepID=UPI003434A9B7
MSETAGLGVPGAAESGAPGAGASCLPGGAVPVPPDARVPDEAGRGSGAGADLGAFVVADGASGSVDMSKKSKDGGGAGTRGVCPGLGSADDAGAGPGAETSPEERNPPPPGAPDRVGVDGGPAGWGGTDGTAPRGGPAGRGGTSGARSDTACPAPEGDFWALGVNSSADQSSPPDRSGPGDRTGFEGTGADGRAGAGPPGGFAGGGGVWEAGGAEAGGPEGGRGCEARRASVPMHPPFPRTGLSDAP